MARLLLYIGMENKKLTKIKKIANGSYEYRGHKIKRIEKTDYHPSYWTVSIISDGTYSEAYITIKEAKYFIDKFIETGY